MSTKILVTYATQYGATQEVAESIAATLRDGGLKVDVQPMRAVKTLDGYQAVVLGAPLYIGKWHEDVRRFLVQHQTALMQQPVAIFALGPIGTDEKEMQGTRVQLDKELANYPWLKPVTIEMFVGKYDPAKLSIAHKMLTVLPASPLHGLTASDNRDWKAIGNWANTLPAQLQG
jgi:menaquinone-dependent protoporphyrinogen oxidase